jgi:hypothetical protein
VKPNITESNKAMLYRRANADVGLHCHSAQPTVLDLNYSAPGPVRSDVIKIVNILVLFTSGFLSGLNAGLQPGI